GGLPNDVDWASLADEGATTIVYMPARTLRQFAAQAMSQGLSGAIPAVAVINATRPDETVVAGTIADLPDRLAATEIVGPVVVLIGRVFADVATAAAVLGNEDVALAGENLEDGDGRVAAQRN
ncbi:MAG TPA: hypothetical protein VEI25_16865, partial [Paraburkholderia sp.]|nr:hypothetical protein [Paraburkholderia sp.]